MKDGLKTLLKRIDEEYPLTLIDVGAMGGIPAKWDVGRDVMQIFAFEPDEREFSKLLLEKSCIRYLNYVLHSTSEDLTFYITKAPGKSSIFRPNERLLEQYEDKERFQIIREERIPARRVKDFDSVIEEYAIGDVDFVKLDTQGSELSILKGGQQRLMPKIFGAQIEVEFLELYSNQSLFHDVHMFMHQNGFQLIDLRRAYWKRKDYHDYKGKGALIFGDALYFKKIEVLLEECSQDQDRLRAKSKILKSIVVCVVYKMYDYAVALATMAHKNEYLPRDDYEMVISEIKKCSQKNMGSSFFLPPRLYYVMQRLLRKFKSKSYLGWADGDAQIGNVDDV